MPSQSVVVNTGHWKTMSLPDCIERVKIPSKILKKQYLNEGTYPIISQEATQISGYWNNSEDVFSVDRPLVVFGDHTCNLKFVDFDFVVGADGVKILKPKEFLEGKFFFYQLLSFNLQSTGYARHFRKLKEYTIAFPPLDEQQKIVSILDEVFKKIEVSSKNLHQLILNPTELFQSRLNHMMDTKEKNWIQNTLEDISEALITKGATPTTYGFPFVEEGIPFLRSECVSDHGFEPNGIRYISEDANEHMKRSIVKRGDILISITGYLGRVVRYPQHMEDANINQHIARVRINDESINPDFVMYQLQTERIQSHYRDVYTGAAQPLLSLKQIRETVVFIPPIEIQNDITENLEIIHLQTAQLEDKYRAELVSLKELKQSVLREAFNGTLRIAEGLADKS